MIKRKTIQARPGRRGALAAKWAIVCLLPLSAPALGEGCQVDPTRMGKFDNSAMPGASYAPGQFAPAILSLDKSNPTDTVVYNAPLPPVPWVCVSTSAALKPFLVPGVNLVTVLSELKKVGLKLVLEFDDLGTWEPTANTTDDRFFLTNVSYAPTSPSDPTLTAHGILNGRMKLVTVTPPTQPVRAFFSAYQNLVSMHYGRLNNTSYISIGSSNNTAVSLIPTCIAKVSTPGTVYLGKAYSAGNLPLPPPAPFTIVADFDETCDGGFRIVDLGNITVPLRIMFQPEGNSALTSTNQGIALQDDDGMPNGLSLRIKQNGAKPITFNQWHDSETLTTSMHPLFLAYSAELEKTGTTLVPGKFSQQVTILVTFQ